MRWGTYTAPATISFEGGCRRCLKVLLLALAVGLGVAVLTAALLLALSVSLGVAVLARALDLASLNDHLLEENIALGVDREDASECQSGKGGRETGSDTHVVRLFELSEVFVLVGGRMWE